MPQVDTERGERLALRALVAAMGVYVVVVLVAGRDLYFWADEFQWLMPGSDFAPQTLFQPHASHLIALPRVVYEAFPRIFGADYLPFRLFAMASFMACVIQAFVLMRRRVGGPIAVGPAIVLLFFGSAQEVVISPLGIPFTLSIAFGLAAFLAAERADLSGDLTAMAMLLLAGLSHTFGTIAAIGLAAYYLADHGRRREAWVALIPIALWIAWWLWAQKFDQGITDSSNILSAPIFVIEAAGASIQALLGLIPVFHGALSFLFGLAGVGLLAVHVARRGWTPWLIAYLVTALAFWFGLGLAESAERAPDVPRYLFFGGVMVLLIVAEAMRGVRPSRRAVYVGAAVLAVAFVGNAGQLRSGFRDAIDRATVSRAQLTPQEDFASSYDPVFKVSNLGPPASGLLASTTGEITAFDASVGRLGFTDEELRSQDEDVREGADFVLVRGLGATAVELNGGKLPPTTGCETVAPSADGYTEFPLSSGPNLVEMTRDTGEPGSELDVGLYADSASVPVGDLTEGRPVILLLPEPDEGTASWIGSATGTIRVCRITG